MGVKNVFFVSLVWLVLFKNRRGIRLLGRSHIHIIYVRYHVSEPQFLGGLVFQVAVFSILSAPLTREALFAGGSHFFVLSEPLTWEALFARGSFFNAVCASNPGGLVCRGQPFFRAVSASNLGGFVCQGLSCKSQQMIFVALVVMAAIKVFCFPKVGVVHRAWTR